MKLSIYGATCAGLLIMANSAVQAVAISGQGTWESTLQGRDLDGNLATFEAYYDTMLDLTWLADANHAQTSGYDDDGRMYWNNATAWAAGLNPYGSGIAGWRLPTTVDSGNDGCTRISALEGVDCGYNLTVHSEMSHMYYVTLGNADYTGPLAGLGPENTGPFSNLQTGYYWSSTEYATVPGNIWRFFFGGGEQYMSGGLNVYYSWAVHDGDVGASAVPVPAAAWLFGSGLLGLVGVSRKDRL